MWIRWNCLGKGSGIYFPTGALRTVSEYSKILSYLAKALGASSPRTHLQGWAAPPSSPPVLRAGPRSSDRRTVSPRATLARPAPPAPGKARAHAAVWSPLPRATQRRRSAAGHQHHQDAHYNKNLGEYVSTCADVEAQPGTRAPGPPACPAPPRGRGAAVRTCPPRRWWRPPPWARSRPYSPPPGTPRPAVAGWACGSAAWAGSPPPSGGGGAPGAPPPTAPRGRAEETARVRAQAETGTLGDRSGTPGTRDHSLAAAPGTTPRSRLAAPKPPRPGLQAGATTRGGGGELGGGAGRGRGLPQGVAAGGREGGCTSGRAVEEERKPEEGGGALAAQCACVSS